MGLFDRLFGKEDVKYNFAIPGQEDTEITQELPALDVKEEIDYGFPDGELVPLEINGVLNTNDPKNRAILRHNLEVLVGEAKAKGSVDRFMLIRDDDILPENSEWILNSNVTAMDELGCALTRTLNTNSESKININVPSVFRSTKHFTVNTPLGVTGDYNWVPENRNYTVLDTADNFLNSGYGYSFSYHDAYLDVTHEPLKISDKAIYLINKDKYEKLKNDPKVVSELSGKNVVIYEGEEYAAIDMLLAQRGCLPTKVGSEFGLYDKETKDIIDSSFRKVAEENGLSFDKAHSGIEGHFTSFIDQFMGTSPHKAKLRFQSFVDYMKNTFPGSADLFNIEAIFDMSDSSSIIKAVGADNLRSAISEYNRLMKEDIERKTSMYKEDRKTITPEISAIFKSTVRKIEEYYRENHVREEGDLVNAIASFFQSYDVKTQLESAKTVNELLTMEKSAKM